MSLLVFDCDGVLVDSEILAIRIEAEMLNDVGVPMTAADIATQCVGLSDPEMHRRIEERFGVTLPPRFADRKQARIAEAFETSLLPVPGMPELVRGIEGPVCVASSSAPPRLRRSLELVGLLDVFDPHVFSATSVEHGKPAPDLFLYAADAMGVAPASCIVVEDSPHGVAAAAAAGMSVIGFVGASHCEPGLATDLEGAGAHHVAVDADDLAGMIHREQLQLQEEHR